MHKFAIMVSFALMMFVVLLDSSEAIAIPLQGDSESDGALSSDAQPRAKRCIIFCWDKKNPIKDPDDDDDSDKGNEVADKVFEELKDGLADGDEKQKRSVAEKFIKAREDFV